VRRPKHVVRRGKTPVLTEEQARRLVEPRHIDVGLFFRSAVSKTGGLTDKPMNRIEAYRMIAGAPRKPALK